MDAVEDVGQDQAIFSPEEISPEHVVVSFLMHRMSQLPKEAISDLTALTPEIANCRNADEFREIAQTIREILFPSELLGEIRKGSPAPGQTESLEKRAGWIGQRIKKLRKEAELTQEELSERSDLPQSHICRLELGQHSPSQKTLKKIAEALKVRISDIDPSAGD